MYGKDGEHAEGREVHQRGHEEAVALPFNLTATDREVLAQTDEEFELHTWENCKDIIVANKLELFKRMPSDLRRYLKWSSETNAAYGSMTNFIVQNRLNWLPPFTYKSSIPFSNTEDFKILRNDWPYGFTSNITHLVVWSKTPIETDVTTGDITSETRRLIDSFVDNIFVSQLGPNGRERVLWFKNWVALQSVRSLEHFHVLVKDLDEATLVYWTR